MLSRLHWYRNGHGLATATSFTPFAIDNKVSSSHSAPAIFDEYKPRELRSQKGKYEKMNLPDQAVLKAAIEDYNGSLAELFAPVLAAKKALYVSILAAENFAEEIADEIIRALDA